MKLSKMSIAYLLVACMLMSFMPVITSAAETTDNYVSSGYTPVSGITSSQQLATEFHLSGLSIYDNAYNGYLHNAESYTEDASVTTALYSTQGNRPVVIGSCGDAWSDFVRDFKIKVTYNDQTKYLPIYGLGTDAGCNWVRFGFEEEGIKAGLGLADDAIVDEIFTTDNVTDFELVPTFGGNVSQTLPFTVNVVANVTSGMGRGKADYEIHCHNVKTTLLAETYPQYFYLGTKKTVSHDTANIIVRKADGSAETLTSTGVTDQNLPLFKDIALSGTYTVDGTAYTFEAVPFTKVRLASGGRPFFTIDQTELLKQVQAKNPAITTIPTLKDTLSNFTLVPRKVNVGKFPEGTIFISPAELKHNSTSGYYENVFYNATYSGYQGFYRNNDIAGIVFTVPEAGNYVLYDAVFDLNGSRGSDVYVNDTKITTAKTGACGISNANPNWVSYWKPTNGTTVTLNKGENVFYLPRQDNIGTNNAGTSYRVLGWALVPADKAPTFTADEAQALASILNANGKFHNLTWLAEKTHGEAYYSYADVTGVTVNSGDALTVVPGAAQARGQAPLRDADGNFIEAPTIVDAIVAAGVDLSTVKAVEVNGKTADPSLTYLSNGMAVTTYTTLDKTNFAPVSLAALNLSFYGSRTNGSNLAFSLYGLAAADARSPLNVLPFLNNTAYSQVTTVSTEATADNLVGCNINGYATLTQDGVTGYAGTGNMAVGEKVYFIGDAITEVVGNATNVNRTDYRTTGNTICVSDLSACYLQDISKHNPLKIQHNKAPWYDSSKVYVTNSRSTNEVVANKIKAGEYQLITTGSAVFNVIITKDGAIQRTLDEQVVTCMEPYNLELNAGEKAYVWNYRLYAGDKTVAGTNMKPLCDVLEY